MGMEDLRDHLKVTQITTCRAILKTGERQNKFCGRDVQDCEQFCGLHIGYRELDKEDETLCKRIVESCGTDIRDILKDTNQKVTVDRNGMLWINNWRWSTLYMRCYPKETKKTDSDTETDDPTTLLSCKKVTGKRGYIKFTRKVKEDTHSETCCICLEDFEEDITIIKWLDCGHALDKQCYETLERSNRINKRCPECRKEY